MLKKRLIFIVYFDSGYFFLSRNFRLQRVGDVRWLVDKFHFKNIGRVIDEIVVLDVSRNPTTERCQGEKFGSAIEYLMKETFVPLTLGGGLKSVTDAKRCFSMGADKILFNSAILNNPNLIRECVSLFGAQAVIGAIDVLKQDGSYLTRIQNSESPGVSLTEHLEKAIATGVGEILVNSIERDGTGIGFDLDLAEKCKHLSIPLILCGGAGKPEHFGQALTLPNVEAAATGHLFNFMGKGFEAARIHLVEQGYRVRTI